MELIGTVRTLRSEYNVPAGSHVRLRLSGVGSALGEALGAEERAVRRLCRVEHIEQNGSASAEVGAHAVLRSGADLFLPLTDIIDVDQERQRLGRELERIEGQLRGTESRLSSEQFTARAPAGIVTREREKAESLRDQRDRLATKLQGLG
jgi:valyl-tRNA synthetase